MIVSSRRHAKMFKPESDKDGEIKKKSQHVECNRTSLNG